MIELDVDEKDDDPQELPKDEEQATESYEANAHDTIQEAKAKAHPADVRMMMSTKKKKSNDKVTFEAKATDVSESLTDYIDSYWNSDSDFQ